MIKKFFFILVFFLAITSNSNARYIEFTCAPDREWTGGIGEGKKIWFNFLKPKFFIHMDLDKLEVLKLGFSKNKEEIEDVKLKVEKSSKEELTELKFLKSGRIGSNANVFNKFTLVTSYNYSYGIFYDQYILNDEQAFFITKEMKADTFSEFSRALEVYTDKMSSYIPPKGGMSAYSCSHITR